MILGYILPKWAVSGNPGQNNVLIRLEINRMLDQACIFSGGVVKPMYALAPLSKFGPNVFNFYSRKGSTSDNARLIRSVYAADHFSFVHFSLETVHLDPTHLISACLISSFPVSFPPRSVPPECCFPSLSRPVERVSTRSTPLMAITTGHSWLHLPRRGR